MPRLFGLFFLILAAPALMAQDSPRDFGIKSKKALQFYEEGMQQSRWRAHREAAKAFEAALQLEPDFAHARLQLGITAIQLKMYEQAVDQLVKAKEIQPEAFPTLDYYLGLAAFADEQYGLAADAFQQFLQRGAGRPEEQTRARNQLKHALFAAEAIRHPVPFEPVNLGPEVNTQYHEYLPYLTADNGLLLFTSRRPESVGGYQAMLRDFSEDFFTARLNEQGSFGAVENLGVPINTEDNEGAAAMSQDGKLIVFTACNRPGGIGNCDLYVSVRTGKGWSEPMNVGPAVNSDGWDSQPCLSHDGKTLYFSSARPGGIGGRDIWASQWTGQEWGPAVNLGEPVNSPGNEDAPFLHADGLTLYFSSDYHPGFGGQDLFVSYRNEGGTWADPINLGYPLNTSAEESNIFVATNGREGFANSDRAGGMGGSDLYRFTIPEAVRPEISTFVRGMVLDSLTSVPVYAAIQVVDVETGDTLRDVRSDRADGRFLMSLPGGRNYAAFVQAPKYLFASQHFSLTDLAEGTYFDLTIRLKPIQEGMQMRLPNLFFESGKWELLPSSDAEITALSEFLQRNPQIRIEIQGHTDNVGSDTDNLALSQRRAEAVKQALVATGIQPERLNARGYGENVPVETNDTEEGRASNRRTEMKVIGLGR